MKHSQSASKGDLSLVFIGLAILIGLTLYLRSTEVSVALITILAVLIGFMLFKPIEPIKPIQESWTCSATSL